jgi:hypothetical protein
VAALSTPPAQSTFLYEQGGPNLQLEETNNQSHSNRNATQGTGKSLVSTEQSALFACFDVFNTSALRNCGTILALENLGFRDIIKYGLITRGYAIRPELFDSAKSLPAVVWLRLVQSELGGFDIKEAFLSGIGLLASLDAPIEALARRHAVWRGDCAESICMANQTLHLDNLTLSSLSFTAAFTENAHQLGINPHDIMNDRAESPFCCTTSDITVLPVATSLRSGHTEHREDIYKNITPDLRPTPIQTSIPHHPCWDVLPWAEFRSKGILASSMNPPQIDEDDLCLDLMHDGVRCWGGAPWDSRSWEAAPWFLTKWEDLIGGRDGALWRNTLWWRSMRNGRT